MAGLRLFWRLLGWDILREVRRREAILNMTLFAVLVLFVVDFGMSPLFARLRASDAFRGMEGAFGAVLYWVAVLFAGTVALSGSFAAEREGNSIEGLLLSPADLGVFYLAKVGATWLYVLVMEVCLLGVYAALFPLESWAVVPDMLLVLGVFSLAYMAAGVFLAAMTSSLRRGGEVVLRILLLPLLLPLIYITFCVEEGTFGASVIPGRPLSLGRYVAVGLSIAALYLAAGFVIFPKVFEE